MGIKSLKETDYIHLLKLIYKCSKFNDKKAQLILEYISCKLIENKFNTSFIDKLQYDTTLTVKNMDIIRIKKQMNKEFTQYELLEISASTFDVINNGYYM